MGSGLHAVLPALHPGHGYITPLRVQTQRLPSANKCLRHCALFRLAFATATPPGLTSRHVPDSQAHSSKGTPSPHQRRALTDCRHTVSGTISLPSRGTFHHSLTVLIHYRSLGSIQAYRVVPADSQQIPRARCYSGTVDRSRACFRLPGSHRLRQTIPGHFT